jgi:hypothetical protein
MADQIPTQSATSYPFDDPLKRLEGRTRYFKRQLGDRAAQAQQLANETVANTLAGLRNQGFNTRNIGGTGAVGTGVLSTINQLQQGQLTGIKNAVTGQQTGNRPETKGTETPLFGPNNIPLNEAARRYAYETQLMDREFGYSKQMLGSEVAAQKDLIQHQFQQQLQYSKSLDPLVQSGLDKHLVRSQALLNTQGNIDARLGILATQGALAKGAQAEAGALARTMAGTNPYAQFANRQSPNIQFG